jgi:hypothetical protein
MTPITQVRRIIVKESIPLVFFFLVETVLADRGPEEKVL